METDIKSHPNLHNKATVTIWDNTLWGVEVDWTGFRLCHSALWILWTSWGTRV